uniref:Uncharacterized protein n=1 Tax=Plectus sambesii TaxID=2011161 RepID=A0A914W9N5_9BILA
MSARLPAQTTIATRPSDSFVESWEKLDTIKTTVKVVEPRTQESTAAPARTFQAGQRVTIRAWKRGKKIWKAAVVVHRYSAIPYTVINASGQQELRHINQMRPRAWPD